MNNELLTRVEYCLKYQELPKVAKETFALCKAALSEPVASVQDKEKPVAWMYQHEETGITSIVDAQQVEWGFETLNPRLLKVGPLYAIPDTHRVVSVELLKQIAARSPTTGLTWDKELRAIIDKEPT